MDELPDLPFEKVLSYLSLEDRIKSRAVSRAWKLKTDNYRVKTLLYSKRPCGFIEGKSRWVSGTFTQNFIRSTRFASFFNTFGRSILSNLKHLRLCDLVLNEKDRTVFIEILQSFGQLEQLDIIRSDFPHSRSRLEFELSLPMLMSIHVEGFNGFDRLTLNAPRLQKVRLDDSLRRLDLVHVDSVERVTIYRFGQIPLKQLKNLKQLYIRSFGPSIDPTLLSDLGQLNEIHLNDRNHVPAIFEQKQRYGRVNLKVYLYGLFLSGPEMDTNFDYFEEELFVYWAENQLRLANEIPFHDFFYYSTIERVAPEAAINIVNRLTDLSTVCMDEPVQEVERFLDFLKNSDSITKLHFDCEQPQELFDRLPECCAVQNLDIYLPPDPQFLFRLKHLIDLTVYSEVDVQFIRRVLEEVELYSSTFHCKNTEIIITIAQKLFHVTIGSSNSSFPDLNSAIQFIVENI